MKTDIVIFENGKYHFKFINPVLAEGAVSKIREEIRIAFEKKTGVIPSFLGEDKSDVDAEVCEVLLGKTNRPESAAPEGVVEESDSYYTVAVIGNKLVISGSDIYQLGVAAKYFIETYLSGEVAEKVTIPGDLFHQRILKDFTREHWRFGGVPAYPVGVNKMVPNEYDCGSTVTNRIVRKRNMSNVSLQRIDRTNEAEFRAYLAKLETYGFEKEYENITAENLFLTYKSADQRVHVAFKPRAMEAQVIYDPKGISVEEFGYSYTPTAGERSEYYLYGLPMTDGKNNGHPNCGTLSVIKCADNSVIIIDGGEYEGWGGSQMYGDEVMGAFDAFLHQITGTADGDKVRVSGWYISHYHSDHTRGLLEFLKKYNENYELERIIANIPIQDCGGVTNTFSLEMTNWVYNLLEAWSDLLKTKYPNCKEMKVHAGQKIQIADVSLEVLYTHEDLLTPVGCFNSADSNDTSTVIRFDNGQMSMMILGDAGQRTESRLRRVFTEATLKSDIVQPAHHMIYDVFAIYKEIQPDFALVPQSYECSQSREKLEGQGSYKDRFDKLVSFVGDNRYFAGNCTVGLAVIDGVIQKCYYVDGVAGRRVGQG